MPFVFTEIALECMLKLKITERIYTELSLCIAECIWIASFILPLFQATSKIHYFLNADFLKNSKTS